MTKNLKIYKKEEFEAFLKFLEEGSAAHWIQVAEALSISKDTITVWKKHPKAQEAIQKGIANAMMKMQSAGKKDWRMWESKLKMLGISPVDRQDLTSEGERIVGPIIYKPENKNKK